VGKKPRETERAALETKLEKLFAEILRAVREDSGFAARLAPLLVPPAPLASKARKSATALPVTPLAEATQPPPPPKASPAAAPLDPFAIYDKGWEQMLREELRRLEIPALREVIFAHELDPRGRSERASSADDLRELIVKAVLERQRI
jgi:hypothetical protein